MTIYADSSFFLLIYAKRCSLHEGRPAFEVGAPGHGLRRFTPFSSWPSNTPVGGLRMWVVGILPDGTHHRSFSRSRESSSLFLRHGTHDYALGECNEVGGHLRGSRAVNC